MYIVKSGDGYVADAETLEMVGNQRDPVEAALHAHRMTWGAAHTVCHRMYEAGFVPEIIELQIGRAPTTGGEETAE